MYKHFYQLRASLIWILASGQLENILQRDLNGYTKLKL